MYKLKLFFFIRHSVRPRIKYLFKKNKTIQTHWCCIELEQKGGGVGIKKKKGNKIKIGTAEIIVWKINSDPLVIVFSSHLCPWYEIQLDI